MKIYFIYSEKHDAILDIGKGRLYSGYMTKNKAESQLKFYFERPRYHNTAYTQWKGRMKFEHVREDWEIVEMELQ